jgi:hypothetical protein
MHPHVGGMEPPGCTTPVLIRLVTPWAWLSTVAACRPHQARHTPVRPAGEHPRRQPRAAIYGTIVASAVIATTAGGHESAELVLEAALATLLVFWLAHVYADFLGHRLRRARSDLRLLASIMVQELSMLVAPALSILFLLLGAIGVLEEALAVGLALWNGVVQLVGWGIEGGTPTRTSVAGGTAHMAGQRRLRRGGRPA